MSFSTVFTTLISVITSYLSISFCSSGSRSRHLPTQQGTPKTEKEARPETARRGALAKEEEEATHSTLVVLNASALYARLSLLLLLGLLQHNSDTE